MHSYPLRLLLRPIWANLNPSMDFTPALTNANNVSTWACAWTILYWSTLCSSSLSIVINGQPDQSVMIYILTCDLTSSSREITLDWCSKSFKNDQVSCCCRKIRYKFTYIFLWMQIYQTTMKFKWPIYCETLCVVQKAIALRPASVAMM